ncbi:transcriptional regulator [Liquorilactobacillus sucicola DSM 21376 = JCM 15457]|uniref:DeoR family transcriptional regulator n=1 Tax=Liquorilactobacillus sucicola DSM 21376 = JCM 15457 TaxID=1423806 RepID=A0A023CZ03_9LACO|nr:DeoR/GlpR family DNA-binding transcription regulator [Liquorilactobacillus sucicola]KRN06619.1 DeoR family transcriptional regulator [Liquorilactobacillus sucicola DSM 21376 = JCM 15457]GAJ27122.1 transcriptional regulator [Liquorilactobacillus sucicola DSM 21376 = JCM 15457]
MIQQKRLLLIKEMLQEKDELTTKYLAKYFNVSADTVRRDILKLVSSGQGIRFHGGIMTMDLNGVPGYKTRSHIKSSIKSDMAQLAARLVSTRGLYFIGTSTTLVQLCGLLEEKNITVITNSIDNALELSKNMLPRVELLGGRLDKGNRYTYSLEMLTQLASFTFDTVFIGTSGVFKDGIFVVDKDDASILKKAVQRARRVIMIAEQYKFDSNKSSPYKVADCSEIDVIITDNKLDNEHRKWFKPNIKIKDILEG